MASGEFLSKASNKKGAEETVTRNRSVRRLARRILPPGSRRRIIAGRIKNLIIHGAWGPNYRYKIWIKKFEPLTLSPVERAQNLKISIIVPTYNTPKQYIE